MDEIASTSTSKRIRTANYSLEEKNVLLQLVQKYKNIIENKKTDASSNAEKESIWRKIYAEFNSVAPNNIERDVTSLKKAYLNMKKTVRKEIAEERLSILKTGAEVKRFLFVNENVEKNANPTWYQNDNFWCKLVGDAILNYINYYNVQKKYCLQKLKYRFP
ncbi:hypothetical protein NQ314_007852 [Rhamnusium bicolor]|uniref:Regulatory protein zeste n=1 Tax=Rhamnusium bicolor TaxID=1586634 RepID=A0AAV8YI85_9CUCU|nr:hypothetical protein NQ314_007852 [Rhamnusium bicolor]